MQRLSGMDASFLYMETPTIHTHVVGTLILDPSTMPTPRNPFETLEELLEARLHVLPQFRWMVRTVPMNIDHPVFIDDPEFDLTRHLKRSALPSPGTREQLAEFVGMIASVPLNRDRPMWKMWMVEGLEDGRVALVSKMHHSGIDGSTGSDMMAELFDLSADAGTLDPPPAWEPEDQPSSWKLASDALVGRAKDPLRSVRAMGRMGSSMLNVGKSAVGLQDEGHGAALPFTAPRTSFNQSITPERSIALWHGELEDLKIIKRAYGTTVNDVVLAACTYSLRNYLVDRDELPDRALVASVPVSVHGATQSEGVNQVSNMFVRIPVHLDDPVDQLLEVKEDTKDAKEMHNAMGADLIQDIASITPPGVFNLGARLYSSTGLANSLPPVHNLVISNVPGPPVPLYVGGMKVVGLYPFGPLLESTGLNLTVISNCGHLDFGAIAARDLIPDPWPIADGFGEGVALLKKAAASYDADNAEADTV